MREAAAHVGRERVSALDGSQQKHRALVLQGARGVVPRARVPLSAAASLLLAAVVKVRVRLVAAVVRLVVGRAGSGVCARPAGVAVLADAVLQCA